MPSMPVVARRRPTALAARPWLATAISGERSVRGGAHARVPGLQPRAALGEGQLAQVLAVDQERIVEAHVRGELLHLPLRHALAVEALLQVVEGGDLAVAQHQQLAVEHGIEVEAARPRRGSCGRCRRRCASRDAPRRCRADDLHADAVPLPLGREVGEVERRPVRVLQRVRQHQRPEHRRVDHVGPRPAPVEPGEQRLVGRRQRVPDLLDVGDVEAGHLGHRRLGEPRRHADAQRAGQQLEQRPAPRGVERVEPGLQPRPQLVAADQGQLGDDVGEAWRVPSPRPLPAGRGLG